MDSQEGIIMEQWKTKDDRWQACIHDKNGRTVWNWTDSKEKLTMKTVVKLDLLSVKPVIPYYPTIDLSNEELLADMLLHENSWISDIARDELLKRYKEK
jgi:hypothetical protein